ncbi:efflux RND transporter periplasmic adaptor subunit [Puniceicoccaceae bacterium]|nr:efflux RND transporter periplasmic adaptor subunit [Puniceicoccaceae bacterium]
MSTKQRGGFFTLLAALVLLFIIGGCGRSNSGGIETQEQLDRFFEVQSGDFNITVLSRGELDAIENYELRFEGKGRHGLRVETLIDDNSEVKAGDIVVCFADEEYVENITLYEESIFDLKVDYEDNIALEEELFGIGIRSLEEALDDATLNIDLFLETQGVARDNSISILTQGSNALETAQDSLNKYENLDYRSQSKEKQAGMDQKEQGYYDAIDEMDKATTELSGARLKDEGTREKAERSVTLAQKKVDNALAAWETARKADRRFRRYDHPQTLRKLTLASERAELNLKRELVKAESDRIQSERRYRKLIREKESILERIEERKEKYVEELVRIEEEFNTQNERLNERLTELKTDLEGLILRAPIDGIVALGAPSRRGRDQKEIRIGVSVSPREVIARVPDLSQFRVRCDIPEIFRSRISLGQKAMLKNAALPNLNMQGTIEDIDSMSQRIVSWDSRSPRVYETMISTNNADPRLMPGMTVEVEILVDTVVDVLFVPVEAVYNKEGKTYCKVQMKFSSEEVEIETGRASDSYVEVNKGLEAGDVVLLHSSSNGS